MRKNTCCYQRQMYPLSSWNRTSLKHSRGWRPGSGSLPPPSKGQELSVNIAACSNLLLINPINISKVLHHEIQTKGTVPQYAIYGRMTEDNPFTCSTSFSYFYNASKGTGGHHLYYSAILGKAVPSSWLSNHHIAFRQNLHKEVVFGTRLIHFLSFF